MSNSNLTYCWPMDFPKGNPEKIGVVPAQGKVYRSPTGQPQYNQLTVIAPLKVSLFLQ